MKDQGSVCRVCSAQDAILLDLFGSQPQSPSYAADVHKCLSVEVSQEDGLSDKICIKCVGLLSDCRPFVEKVLKLVEDKKERSVSVTECYFCLSSENCLFPIPASSISKAKDCFEVKVLTSHQICHKCQFHLESIHELKQKALSTLKNCFKESMSPQKDMKQNTSKTKCTQSPKARNNLSENDESFTQKNCGSKESVDDIVNNLKQRFKMGEDEPKCVKVRIVDIKLIIGPDFLSQGTINVTEFFQKLNPPSTPSIDSVSKRGRKKSSLSSGKESSLKGQFASVKPYDPDKSPVLAPEKSSRAGKRSRESSETDADKPSKRSQADNEKEDASRTRKADTIANCSEDENVIKNLKRKKLGKAGRGLYKSVGGESEKEEQLSTREIDESLGEGGDKDGMKKKHPDDQDVSGPSNRLTGQTEHAEPFDESVDEGKENEGQSKEKRKKRKSKNVNFSKYFDDDDRPQAIIRRKRRESEDDHNESLIQKARKRRWEPSHNGEDQEVDEPSTADSVENVEQPEFLKDLDELLKFTPKHTFRPFICSVCHEGYVSTVKGKLHKLIVHDPHSKNMTLMLERCDSHPEMEKLKERLEKEKLERESQPLEIPCDASEKESIGDIIDDDVDNGNEDDITEGNVKTNDGDKSKGENRSNEVVRSKENVHDSEDDDLFACGPEVKRAETTDAFEALLKSTSANENKDQETVNPSIAEKKVDKVNSSRNDSEEGDSLVVDLDTDDTNINSDDKLFNSEVDQSEAKAMESEDVPKSESLVEKNIDLTEGEIDKEREEKKNDVKVKDWPVKDGSREEESIELKSNVKETGDDMGGEAKEEGEIEYEGNKDDDSEGERKEEEGSKGEKKGEEIEGESKEEEENKDKAQEEDESKNEEKDADEKEAGLEPVGSEKQVLNVTSEIISHEDDGVILCSKSPKDRVSGEGDDATAGKVDESPDSSKSDEGQHADVESNGESGERSDDEKDCPEKHSDREIEPTLCDKASNGQEELHTSAVGITVGNN